MYDSSKWPSDKNKQLPFQKIFCEINIYPSNGVKTAKKGWKQPDGVHQVYVSWDALLAPRITYLNIETQNKCHIIHIRL